MSIRAAIDRHVRGGRLFAFEMTLDSDPVERGLYLSAEMKALMNGPWSAPQYATRVMRLRADFESFVKGERVSVCLDPYQAGEAFFGRLHASEDEVWDIRSRDPRPALRIFGRFAAPDHFIAFSWRPRSRPWNERQPMGDRNDPQWEVVKADCRRQWRTLFPQHEPIHGDHVNEYITRKGVPVGDL